MKSGRRFLKYRTWGNKFYIAGNKSCSDQRSRGDAHEQFQQTERSSIENRIYKPPILPIARIPFFISSEGVPVCYYSECRQTWIFSADLDWNFLRRRLDEDLHWRVLNNFPPPSKEIKNHSSAANNISISEKEIISRSFAIEWKDFIFPSGAAGGCSVVANNTAICYSFARTVWAKKNICLVPGFTDHEWGV